MHSSSWQELLGRVREDAPAMLADFLEELGRHEGYADGQVPAEDLERTALQAFDLFLERLAAPEGASVSHAFTQSLGRRRARQGLRVDQFAEGVRINFRVLWRALHRAAQPDLIGELVGNGERVLGVVEGYATEVQRAFLDETQIMAQSHRTARERALSRLFSGQADAEELSGAADTLGLRPDGIYELVVVVSGEPARELRGPGVLAYDDGETTCLFRPRREGSDWPSELPDLDGAYISRVHGVAGLVGAASIGRELAEVRVAGGLITLRDGFGALAHARVAARLAGFEHELVGRFHEAPDDERERLASTVRVFLETGSVQRSAEALFLHRNTVFKRLRSFQDLTGLDVTIPRDAAIALILLCAGPAGVGMHTSGPNSASS